MFEIEVFSDGEIRIERCRQGPLSGRFVVVSSLETLRFYLTELGFDTGVESILDAIKVATPGRSMELKLNGSMIPSPCR